MSCATCEGSGRIQVVGSAPCSACNPEPPPLDLGFNITKDEAAFAREMIKASRRIRKGGHPTFYAPSEAAAVFLLTVVK